MQIDISLLNEVDGISATAARAESEGYQTAWIGETRHDPFLQALLVGEATQSLKVGTSIAVAFARAPMTVAYTSYDLSRYTRGRFILGLGTQVKPHIERRFSMPWSHPAARIGEYVEVLRAIWQSWLVGAPPEFSGEFYNFTLMTPFFTPEPHSYGAPEVYLAAVGDVMTEVVGRVADGWFFHPFTTQSYLSDVSLPALERGRKSADRPLNDLVITGPAFVATGRDDQEIDAAIEGTKKQIAFYASTPSYRAVLEFNGWADLGPQLTGLSKQGRWDEMTELITDEIFDAMAAAGTPDEAGRKIYQRWGQVADSVTLYANYESDSAIWPVVAAAARGADGGR